MPGISRLNPLTNLPAAANGGRGTGAAQDPVLVNGVNQLPTNSPEQAPPKANAAAGPGGSQKFKGLAEALNLIQQKLVKEGRYEVADEYEIEFAPASLGDSSIVKAGNPEKSKTPMDQNPNPKNQKDPETNSMNTKARIASAFAGMSIAQFIDQQMRNSSYIMDQSNTIYDEETGKPKPQAPLGNIAWYKVSVTTTPKSPYFDKKRNDYAYKIKYTISPYSITSLQSDYFPDPTFRGVHKSYNYWFTGKNIEILNFEQQINAQYRVVMSGVPDLTRNTVNNRIPRVYQPASDQSSMGADGKTNEPAANAADWLYNMADYKSIKLRIVGDPAWLQQGEVSTGVSAKSFSFNPFNDDGTINFDAGEALFDIAWIAPTDYDFNMGLVDPSKSQSEAATYQIKEVRSYFKQGKFEQELDGVLIDRGNTSVAAAKDAGRPPVTATTAPAVRVAEGVQQAQAASNTDSSEFTNTRQPNLINSSVLDAQRASNTNLDQAEDTTYGPTTPEPSPAAEPPESNGELVPGNEFSGPPKLPKFGGGVAEAQGAAGSPEPDTDPQLINREY